MPSSARDLFDELTPHARSVICEVGDYFCLQVAGSLEPDLLTPLYQVRESLSCLALVGELSEGVRAELSEIAPRLLHPASTLEPPLEQEAVICRALPELALWVASARLEGEDFDGDEYDPYSLSSPGHLPDHESFRRGDLVFVCDRDSEHFGREARFGLYTDPRLDHSSRLARVSFSGGKETAVLPTSALRFAPERYGNERQETHLRTFARDGFELRVFDTGRCSNRHGKVLVHYQLFDHRFEDGVEPIFEGADFSVSPLHAPDEDSTLASLLAFLAFQRGEVEAEYFEDYTPRQIAWRDERAGDLAMVVWDLEESASSDDS